MNCGGTSVETKFSCLQPYIRSGVAIRKNCDLGSMLWASMFRRSFAAQNAEVPTSALRLRQQDDFPVCIICNEVDWRTLLGHLLPQRHYPRNRTRKSAISERS